MVSVLHSNKHLIEFPIDLDYVKLRNRGCRNKMENSTHSTNCSNRGHKTKLLKAATGANMNLMNIQTFDSLFADRKVLQLTPIRMENNMEYWCTSTGKVPCISPMEGQSIQAAVLCHRL